MQHSPLVTRKVKTTQVKNCNTKLGDVATGVAKLMSLPAAPRLPPGAGYKQQAAYNGYLLAITACYYDVLRLQQQKNDYEWLPVFMELD